MASIKAELPEQGRQFLPSSSVSRVAMAFKVSTLVLIIGFLVCIHYPSICAGKPSRKYTPLGVPYKEPPIAISRKIQHARSIPFKPNDGWLGMNLDYQYAEPLAKELNSTEVPLQTRGESHITVITPPEFSVLATANVTVEEINAIALDLNIQSTRFDLVCLGKEELTKDGKDYVVYQVIVDAPNLVKIREAIFRLYASKGGNTALFDPQYFKPHITIAFTVNDLFDSDGVYKGYNVCHRPLKITN